jgi:probable HAF family extracellular repeat protein
VDGFRDVQDDVGGFDSPIPDPADINNHGEIVGRRQFPNSPSHAFFWSHNTGLIELENVPGHTWCEAQAVNDNSVVVGFCATGPRKDVRRPFKWTKETGVELLPTLTNLPGAAGNGLAHDINNLGEIVGQSAAAEGETHAALWPADGGVLDLASPGSPRSAAVSINSRGEVAGMQHVSHDGELVPHAILWTESLGPIDIEEDYVLSSASGINNLGTLVGYGRWGLDPVTTRPLIWLRH